MKTLRKQFAVAILTLTMAVSAYAGILQTPGYVGGTGGNDTTNSLTNATTLIVTIVTIVP